MAKTLKDYKDWIDTYENPTESEQELIDSFKDILDEIFANYKNELAEKDRKIEQLKLRQLYKEDFYQYPYSMGVFDWILDDSTKYDLLDSKEKK